MGTTAKVSIRDYLSYEAPEGYRHELIEGEIVLSPEPKPLHEDICRNLVRELETALAGSGFLVRTRTNAILHADESMPSPDVFVIDKTRWTNARDNDTYPEGSPQLPVEVYSPANRPGILRRKIGLYLKNGALAVWVVYPKSRTITVHEQSDLTAEYRMGEHVPLPAALSRRSIGVAEIFKLE
jgi:Uma2 family endonuclease